MNPELEKAVEQFPIMGWLKKHTKVYGGHGSNVVYADCPVCGGTKKLGVYRRGRLGIKLAVCGRCKEGGHGQGKWRGVANVPTLVKLLEGSTWRETFKLIHSLAGIPEPEWKPRDRFVAELPKEGIPLRDCSNDERGHSLLVARGVGHLLDTALLCIGGKYHERIILPTFYLGEATGFEAKGTIPTQEPKSLYAPGMETDRTVYTARTWNKGSTSLCVTESVIDAETFHSTGYNAVGCYGGFKAGQLASLLNLNPTALYWFVDADAWSKIWDAIKIMMPFVKNYVVPMPEKGDPNSVGADGCVELIEEAVLIEDHLDFMEVSMKWGHGL
jgi:hypothetical protein